MERFLCFSRRDGRRHSSWDRGKGAKKTADKSAVGVDVYPRGSTFSSNMSIGSNWHVFGGFKADQVCTLIWLSLVAKGDRRATCSARIRQGTPKLTACLRGRVLFWVLDREWHDLLLLLSTTAHFRHGATLNRGVASGP